MLQLIIHTVMQIIACIRIIYLVTGEYKQIGLKSYDFFWVIVQQNEVAELHAVAAWVILR